jgi:hypothetical protein
MIEDSRSSRSDCWLQLSRPGVVIEVGPVEIEDVRQAAVGSGSLHLSRVIADRQGDQLDLHLLFGGVERIHLLAQSLRLHGVHTTVVKPGRDVCRCRPAQLAVARGVGRGATLSVLLPTGCNAREGKAAGQGDDPPS